MSEKSKKKMSAYEVWKLCQKKGYSDEKYKQLLIENGIIVKKPK